MEDDTVRLDNWINLQMNPQTVAKILSLRPGLSQLISEVSANPEMVSDLGKNRIVQVIAKLCSFQAADFEQSRSDAEVRYLHFQSRIQPGYYQILFLLKKNNIHVFPISVYILIQ